MKANKALFLFLFFPFLSYAQTDTIFTNNDKISCIVKEVTTDGVKFVYIDEDVPNTLFKNVILKIKFKSGRVQTFSESTSFKTVTGVDDYENVSTTQVFTEVQGLFKIGDISSKAKGTTSIASMEKVKERAYKKLKLASAMMGGNIIFLTQNQTKGNQIGNYYQFGNPTETNLAGVTYSNKLPSFDDFKIVVSNKSEFKCFELITLTQTAADFERNKFLKKVVVDTIINENGFIIISAKIGKSNSNKFRVINFSNEEFTIVDKEGQTIYNYRIKI